MSPKFGWGTVGTAGLCSRRSNASDGSLIWKLLHLCLVFGDGCQRGGWMALHLDHSMWGYFVLPHCRVAELEGQVSWEREQMEPVSLLWPSLGSPLTPLLPHLLLIREVCPCSNREKIDLSFWWEDASRNLSNACGIGICILVWPSLEIQSATVCICGKFSQ